MEAIWIITHLLIWGVGIVTGMYFSSQVEKHIDKNIARSNKSMTSCTCKKQSHGKLGGNLDDVHMRESISPYPSDDLKKRVKKNQDKLKR